MSPKAYCPSRIDIEISKVLLSVRSISQNTTALRETDLKRRNFLPVNLLLITKAMMSLICDLLSIFDLPGQDRSTDYWRRSNTQYVSQIDSDYKSSSISLMPHRFSRQAHAARATMSSGWPVEIGDQPPADIVDQRAYRQIVNTAD